MSQKSYDHTCNNTMARTCKVIDNICVNNAFFFLNNVSLKAINPILKGRLINRILHSWSFYMKLMKLAKSLFHKFHIK